MRPTLELTRGSQHSKGGKTSAGLVLISAAGKPAYKVIALGAEGVLLGREGPADWFADDERVSRQHMRVRRVAGCWVVEDLQSRNGSFAAGVRLTSPQTFGTDVLLSLGHSLVWAVADLAAHLDGENTTPDADGVVLGAAMRAAFREVALATRSGSTLLVLGPSGAGKELAARAYHEAAYGGDTRAPFVAVNCATIPEGVAERLLFGAKRGAYSGASHDVDGYLVSAHNGTLFLDELAELDLTVQAKLLRVLETREVVPLGATHGKPVNVRICAATLKDLKARVAEGRFRDDLYYRIGRPEVTLPALRQRLDELPWLITRTVHAVDPTLRVATALVEACALREWPGNVRELLGEVRRAAFQALQQKSDAVRPSHLSQGAGERVSRASDAPVASAPAENAEPARKTASDAEIEAALREHQGNVTGAARALGIHRNQLRRWLARRDGGPGPEGVAQSDPDEDGEG